MWKKIIVSGLMLGLLSAVFAFPADAAEHYTVIINQVRGTECCSPGSVENLRLQLNQLRGQQLAATFALRYDVLQNNDFLQLIHRSSSAKIEWAAFLEITPALAHDAGVAYRGNEESWYQAEIAYPIGYTLADRQKLISTYMTKFNEVFGFYPKTVVAWMIDATSLQILKRDYDVRAVEITREQFGTDSYTLYGGPSHYPYSPSSNWALVPFFNAQSGNIFNAAMPIVLRQTISDPVNNYGDHRNCYTSQPNDYFLCQADISYFTHLYTQAQQQPTMTWNFALLGLENSMPLPAQEEFFNQLAQVAKFQQSQPNSYQLTAAQFVEQWQPLLTQQSAPVWYPEIYGGQNGDDINDQAWWIDTPFYRARLRLNDHHLYLSDLRLYHENWTDPYLTQPAQSSGWWIVPFVLDGSRYFHADTTLNLHTLANDQWKDRTALQFQPTALPIANNVEGKDLQINSEVIDGAKQLTLRINDQAVLRFTYNHFAIPQATFDQWQKNHFASLQHQLLQKVLPQLAWLDTQKNILWGFQSQATTDGWQNYQPLFAADFASLSTASTVLQNLRQSNQPLLFPELKVQPVSAQYSFLLKNNRFAIAGRNPVRLVFFPKDNYGFPVELQQNPEVATSNNADRITLKKQSQQNGMLFIDIENTKPGTSTFSLQQNNFQESVTIYFAPNCKQNWRFCITHPQQASWYFMAKFGDIYRIIQDKINNRT